LSKGEYKKEPSASVQVWYTYCPFYHAGNINGKPEGIEEEFKKVAAKFNYHNNRRLSRCHELSLKHPHMTFGSLTGLEYSIQRITQGINYGNQNRRIAGRPDGPARQENRPEEGL
jgi:hypothetical protein